MRVNSLRMVYKWGALLALATLGLVVYDHFLNGNALQIPLLLLLTATLLAMVALLFIRPEDPNPPTRRNAAPVAETTLYGGA